MSHPDLDGPTDGDVGTVASGDGDTDLTTVFEAADAWGLFLVDTLIIDYTAGSTASTLEIHDADTSAAAADLDSDTLRHTAELSASGERIVLTNVTLRDFEQDVIADPDGSQDADVQITVGGHFAFTR